MNWIPTIKRFTVFLLSASLVIGCTSQQIQSTLETLANAGEGGLSNEEIGKGLKQALELGISEGAQRLSKQDGYYKSPYKILLPEEARKVADKLQNIPGFRQVEEVILEKINRGAEDAAAKAKPSGAAAEGAPPKKKKQVNSSAAVYSSFISYKQPLFLLS